MPRKKNPNPIRTNRKGTFRETRAWQETIDVGRLIKKLQDHVLGEPCMTSTQVRAAEVLLDRKMPKLAAIDVTSDGEPMNDRASLVQIISRLQLAGWQPPTAEPVTIEHDTGEPEALEQDDLQRKLARLQ